MSQLTQSEKDELKAVLTIYIEGMKEGIDEALQYLEGDPIRTGALLSDMQVGIKAALDLLAQYCISVDVTEVVFQLIMNQPVELVYKNSILAKLEELERGYASPPN